MLNARVFSFRVLANENSVNITIGRLVSFNRYARPNVSEKGKGSAECEVE